MKKIKTKTILLLLVSLFTLSLWLMLFYGNSIWSRTLREQVHSNIYDWLINYSLTNKPISSSIVIIDIDEKSLQNEGRWPWPRTKIAELLNQLKKFGVVVVAFDVVFNQKGENLLEEIKATDLPSKEPELYSKLVSSSQFLNIHQPFINAIKNLDTVLGFIFDNDPTPSSGALPPPIYQITDNSPWLVQSASNYRGILPELLNAAKASGFVTTFPDDDGVLRRTPLVLRYQNKIYPSLALAAVQLFLLENPPKLILAKLNQLTAIKGLQLGSHFIPTDASGQVLIPYTGDRFTYPFISATDVLQGKIKPGRLTNTLAFIGTSTLAMSDMHATPIQSLFPGVEIQANVAGMLLASKKFPYRPLWAEGAELLNGIAVGLLAALILPFLNAFGIVFFTVIFLAIIILLNYFFWIHYYIDLSLIPATFGVLLIASINLIYDLFFESYQRKKLKQTFSQYIPASRVEIMSDNPKHADLEGKTKTLTVLFADIIGFTGMTEKLSADQVKEMLNIFFTTLTEVIFEYHGTIDKYIGDMVMAFWGAPIPDEKHQTEALESALKMIQKINSIAPKMRQLNLPTIHLGIGVNTGDMYVGDMGSKYRLSYTVIGDPVNLASRIQSLTRQYGVDILTTGSTAKEQKGFNFKFLDKVKVKGKEEVIEIFELIDYKKNETASLLTELKQHKEAMELFYARNWQEAKRIFQELHNRSSNKVLYEMYLNRIGLLLEHPPGDDWDGVYTWTQK